MVICGPAADGTLKESTGVQPEILSTPGPIPGGTGNALSVSLLGEKAGFDPQYTALQVIKGMSHRVKLWETSQVWLNIKLTFRKTYGL